MMVSELGMVLGLLAGEISYTGVWIHLEDYYTYMFVQTRFWRGIYISRVMVVEEEEVCQEKDDWEVPRTGGKNNLKKHETPTIWEKDTVEKNKEREGSKKLMETADSSGISPLK